MFLRGRIWKEGAGLWLIEIPGFDVMTQGHTRQEALEMAKDAVESLGEDLGLKVAVVLRESGQFLVASDNVRAFIALFLRRQRQKSGYTLMEVAERLGSKSPNAFARYEQGKVIPSIEKLVELYSALWPGKDDVSAEIGLDRVA
jgi:hypothetical protein